MARMSYDELAAVAAEKFGAVPDTTGKADFTSEKGSIIIAAETGDMKEAFKRIKKVDGYRWVVMNKSDLFAANTLSLGSKAGIIAGDGSILKNADIPRKKM